MTATMAAALTAVIIATAVAALLAVRHYYTAVKRVAATAGDPLPAFLPPQITATSELLPAGQLAVLGDNRTASVDSRSWGLVPAANVLAKVVRKL